MVLPGSDMAVDAVHVAKYALNRRGDGGGIRGGGWRGSRSSRCVIASVHAVTQRKQRQAAVLFILVRVPDNNTHTTRAA